MLFTLPYLLKDIFLFPLHISIIQWYIFFYYYAHNHLLFLTLTVRLNISYVINHFFYLFKIKSNPLVIFCWLHTYICKKSSKSPHTFQEIHIIAHPIILLINSQLSTLYTYLIQDRFFSHFTYNDNLTNTLHCFLITIIFLFILIFPESFIPPRYLKHCHQYFFIYCYIQFQLITLICNKKFNLYKCQ